jgi:FAD/FMN-containing dehydrogenase
MMRRVVSWGRLMEAMHDVREPAFLDDVANHLAVGATTLGYGLGRSYGDVCLNDGGRLVAMHRLDRMIAADWKRGVIRAEAGISFDQLLRVCLPRGWFLPVTPGTKFVTLGGAVANDVHGKNHEIAGTLGCHVRAIGLRRSSGDVLTLGPQSHSRLFAATIGGLGLTGLILWVELSLHAVRSAYFETETIRLRDLDDFFEVAGQSQDWPYTVAWVDCLASGRHLGRGLFTRARHAADGGLDVHRDRKNARVPIDAPASLLSAPVVRAFNAMYLRRPGATGRRRMHYDSFLFPLDRLGNWNRLYGRDGFYQHQSVVPMAAAPKVLRRLLEATVTQGHASVLGVLKLFGSRSSQGILSFPMEGATLALDLPNRGQSARDLLALMADVVLEAGGRIYPAKDAAMSPRHFQAGFPRWREVEEQRDPAVRSDFWRRVIGDRA